MLKSLFKSKADPVAYVLFRQLNEILSGIAVWPDGASANYDLIARWVRDDRSSATAEAFASVQVTALVTVILVLGSMVFGQDATLLGNRMSEPLSDLCKVSLLLPMRRKW